VPPEAKKTNFVFCRSMVSITGVCVFAIHIFSAASADLAACLKRRNSDEFAGINPENSK